MGSSGGRSMPVTTIRILAGEPRLIQLVGNRAIQSRGRGVVFLQLRPAERHQGAEGADRQVVIAFALGLQRQSRQTLRRVGAHLVEHLGQLGASSRHAGLSAVQHLPAARPSP